MGRRVLVDESNAFYCLEHKAVVKSILTIFFICLAIVACQKKEDSLTIVSLGGVHTKAQKVAFYTPFFRADKTPIIAGSYNGGLAKIRSMIETKQIDWDIVQVETANLIRGCSEGLFEPIDKSTIGDVKQFIKGNFSECGVGFFSWSIIIAYDKNKLKKTPENWQDFWNIEDFPGYRGLQKTAVIALEAALLADGVKPENIYAILSTPEGEDRAFNKLDQLKPYIKWWEKGSQPIPMLLSGDVVMTTTFNGRGVIAEQEGKPIGLIWKDNFYDVDNFAIIKGTKHKQLSQKFIAFSLSAKAQKEFSEYSHYGFVNNLTAPIINQPLLSQLPNNPETMQHAYKINANFWVDRGESIEQRFNAWASQ